MSKHIRLLAITLVASLFSLSTPLVASDLALAGAKAYPSLNDPPIRNATIVIHNGRISAAGPNE